MIPFGYVIESMKWEEDKVTIYLTPSIPFLSWLLSPGALVIRKLAGFPSMSWQWLHNEKPKIEKDFVEAK